MVVYSDLMFLHIIKHFLYSFKTNWWSVHNWQKSDWDVLFSSLHFASLNSVFSLDEDVSCHGMCSNGAMHFIVWMNLFLLLGLDITILWKCSVVLNPPVYLVQNFLTRITIFPAESCRIKSSGQTIFHFHQHTLSFLWSCADCSLLEYWFENENITLKNIFKNGFCCARG